MVKVRYPKIDWKKIMPGTKLPQMSMGDLKCLALIYERHNEYVICDQPIRILSFILKLLENKSSFSAPCQAQSMPKGYRYPPLRAASTVSFALNSFGHCQALSKRVRDLEKASLYNKPVYIEKIPIMS